MLFHNDEFYNIQMTVIKTINRSLVIWAALRITHNLNGIRKKQVTLKTKLYELHI